MKFIYKAITTVFGSGYTPKAPGTAGAIIACVFLWLFNECGIIFTHKTPLLFGLLILITLLIGIVATNQLEKEWGKDPSKIVIDELVGMWITMLLIPFTWVNLLIGFILFRFFDIAKPLGIRKMEHFKGGIGVMMDDVLAGIYANIVLQIIIYFT